MTNAIATSYVVPTTSLPTDASATEPLSATVGGAAPLPAPCASIIPPGDMGAQLAALLVKTGDEQRRQDETSRITDEKCEDAADKAQVDDLQQKAHDIRKEGLVEGLTTMGSGALEIGAACAGSSKAWSGALTGASKGIKGGGEISGAAYKGEQTIDDANAASDKANADHAKRAADDQADQMKNDHELISAAIDFYKEYSDAQAQGRAAVLHRS